METTAATEIMETVAETVPTQIIEVIDYTETLNNIQAFANLTADASVLIAGFLLFFVVVTLCYFVYKFFRIFF